MDFWGRIKKIAKVVIEKGTVDYGQKSRNYGKPRGQYERKPQKTEKNTDEISKEQ